MWSECLRFGAAAITYAPLSETDLSKYPPNEPKALWAELAPAQKSSLRRLVYEMKAGDVIYVKDGSWIIDKGIITEGYKFDRQYRIIDPNNVPWTHQVSVDWSHQFEPIKIQVGSPQQYTIVELPEIAVQQLESIINSAIPLEPISNALSEDAYYRESPARLKTIEPQHNKLSNEFRAWLQKQYKIRGIQERARVDICFKAEGHSVIAELKICFGVGTTKSIREALGQLFEYNHYPSRKTADAWFIILDDEPSDDDKRYIYTLRVQRSLPLTLGWKDRTGFSFYPEWPFKN